MKSEEGDISYCFGRLNQTLNNGRWTLIRKVGWGPRSSCWLAVDSQNTANIEVIKIYTVSASQHPGAVNERDILQKMHCEPSGACFSFV